MSLARLASLATAALLAAACNARDVPQASPPAPVSSPVADAPVAAPVAARPGLAPFPPNPPHSCTTLRDVGVSDIVRVDGTTLYYADASAGLTVVDVADAAQPRVLSVVPFLGTPVALFVREGIAWVVYVDSDSRSATPFRTVVRAVDVRVPAAARIIGDQIREGSARDATLVAGFLYLMRGTNDRTTVEAFGVAGTALAPRGSVELGGAPAQLAASPAGLAVVTSSPDHTDVTWLDLSLETPGSIFRRRSVRLPGGIASWEHGEGKIIDADEGQRVRLVTCATRACTPTDPATLRIVDFATEATARTPTSLRLTEHDGLPAARFVNGALYVVETAANGSEASTLHVVATDDASPRFVAHHPLRGRIAALVPHEGSLVALGSTGSPETQLRLIVHEIDVRRPFAPRTRTSVSFGSDWTWSIVADDDRAMSFDPVSRLVAIPFTAWRRGDGRHVNGAQLVDLRPHGGQLGTALPVDGWVERAVFLDGHLVTLGPSGVASVDYASMHVPDLGEGSISGERPR
ncbi:hypothetical protein BH11MYX4_BH11MYX4_13840 [soil metagenome]